MTKEQEDALLDDPQPTAGYATPRIDAEQNQSAAYTDDPLLVTAAFARGLERELNEALLRIDILLDASEGCSCGCFNLAAMKSWRKALRATDALELSRIRIALLESDLATLRAKCADMQSILARK